jgi:peptide/nickel transport system ATP-binding protein
VTGSILLNGEQLIGRKQQQLQAIRGAGIAMVFQDPMTALNPVYTVGWQLSEAVRAHQSVSKGEAWKRAVDLLDLVGIPQPDRRASSYPHEFSGGMRQRAMIAMAIANDPDVIIADEPTTALDVTVQAQILELLVKVKDETDSAIILITHDLGVVAGMADRMLVMYAGRVVEQGSVDDVYYSPRMPYTVGLLGSLPTLDSEGGRLRPIVGAPPSLINLPPGCPFSPRCPLAQPDCLGEEPPFAEVEANHWTACYHWRDLAAMDDSTNLFAARSTT